MSDQQSNTYIPDGYVAIRSDNGQHYLVPPFMIPATQQAMEAYCKKIEFDVHMADGGVRFSFFRSVILSLGRCQAVGRCRLWPMPFVGRCRLLADAIRGPTASLGSCWLDYPSLSLMNLQSGNMRDTPYYIVARNMLQLPADPVSAVSSFA